MHADDQLDDELLSASGVPRWLTLLVVAALALVVGGVVVAKLSSGSSAKPAALPSSTVPTPTPRPSPRSSTPSGPTPLPSGVAAFPLQFVGPPTTVVADDSRVYAIDDGAVVRRSVSSTYEMELHGNPTFSNRSRLAVDAARRNLWVAVPQKRGYTLIVLDVNSFAPKLRVSWPRAITGLVAEGGALWVVGPAGLYRLPETGGVQRIALPSGRPVGLAADPVRGRVLVLLRSGAVTELAAVRPGAKPTVRPIAGAAMVAATSSGELWLAGRTVAGSYLVRLDPADLHVIGNSVLGEQFASTPIILAAGKASVLVSAGPAVGRVWCVGGENGSVSQYWDVAPRAAAMTSVGAYAVLSNGLVRLEYTHGGCAG